MNRRRPRGSRESGGRRAERRTETPTEGTKDVRRLFDVVKVLRGNTSPKGDAKQQAAEELERATGSSTARRDEPAAEAHQEAEPAPPPAPVGGVDEAVPVPTQAAGEEAAAGDRSPSTRRARKPTTNGAGATTTRARKAATGDAGPTTARARKPATTKSAATKSAAATARRPKTATEAAAPTKAQKPRATKSSAATTRARKPAATKAAAPKRRG